AGPGDVGCVKACLDYLERKVKEGNDKPFFVYCTLSYPHPPYMTCEPWFSLIDRNALPPRRPWCADKPSMMIETADNMDLHDWSEERWNELRAVYLGMVARLDDWFGQVVNKLKELNLYDDTSLFFFADHGDYTGDYDIAEKLQNCFEDDLVNVPLIIKPAKQFECQPRITEALAELTDVSATMSEMTGVKYSYVSFGKSLLPVLAGSEVGKDAVFAEGGRIHGETQAMELGHFDPRDPYWPRLNVQQKEGPQHTKATMIRMGDLKYIKRLYEKDELYDLKKDPQELVNEIDNPEYRGQLLKMKERMLTWYQETADYVPNRRDARKNRIE
ncbi:MAG: sulfatase-like hydrolase/transferase, partial [Erysipelotrichaceae bacterium]|nr:sulfatase-like hydrolase/transferase [Erysipelotrichaceae bacterium]